MPRLTQYLLGLLPTTNGLKTSHPESKGDCIPPHPSPESISITTLPLPPVVNNTSPGACTAAINPRGTGCTAQSTGLQCGTFTSDGDHIVATIRFAGAPSAPDPASVYSGQQVILVKADRTTFPNGDAWKCVTCGVPEENRAGVNLTGVSYSYPQAFRDGRKVLAERFIVDCGDSDLVSDECTPAKTTIRPIRLDDQSDGSGPGAEIRELRIHPDNVHLGFNVFNMAGGKLQQVAYTGRLTFNADPEVGNSRELRYDLTHVNQLLDPNAPGVLTATGDELHINHSALTVGELRGFSGSGDEVLYIGYPSEACNIDVYAAHLTTGRVRRLTSHPGYVDPVQMSPDDEWMVIMDTRYTNRTLFMDGLRGIPPLTDIVTTTACSSVRNNGVRHFFQPWLLDRYGDRGDYFGQEINGARDGFAGSGAIDDPEWNGMADPWFSPDGTKIAYWQAHTVSPACGGENPLPCYESKEPGGRQERLMVAHLTSRDPALRREVFELSDEIPWAVPYVPGDPAPVQRFPEPGTYTLKGRVSGSAHVEFIAAPNSSVITAVNATFRNFSDDGLRTVCGHRNVAQMVERFTLDRTSCDVDVEQTGKEVGRQWTSEGGFEMEIDVLINQFEANGTLMTKIAGDVYRQPKDGT